MVIQSWGLPLEDFLGREGKSVISFIDEKANDALGLLGIVILPSITLFCSGNEVVLLDRFSVETYRDMAKI